MGPGTLYGAVKRLLEAGLVEEAGERDDPAVDERRRYYRITGAGRSAVAAETARLRRLVDFAHGNLRGSVRA
jgi:DNA-binding PadR family transcriptional regulator